MPFCSQCGARADEGARFCGSCGAALGAASPPPTPQPQAPPATGPVVALLPGAKKMKMMGLYDTYTIVFTPDQAVFARLSSEVLKDAVVKSQQQSKAEGKGWLARVGSQMQAFNNAHERYRGMTPQQILGEDKNNFALPHAAVAAVKIKRKVSAGDEDGPGEPYLEIEWQAVSGKYKFRVEDTSQEVYNLLGGFYAGRIGR